MVDLNKLLELAKQVDIVRTALRAADERMGDDFDEDLIEQLAAVAVKVTRNG